MTNSIYQGKLIRHISSEITGDVNINYEISAKDITSSDAKKIDGST